MKEKIANFINNIRKNKIAESTSKKNLKIENINYNNNLTFINLKALISRNLFQFLGISFLLGLLIFLLNILM